MNEILERHLMGASFGSTEPGGIFVSLARRDDGGFNVIQGTPHEITHCATLDFALKLIDAKLRGTPFTFREALENAHAIGEMPPENYAYWDEQLKAEGK